MTDINTFNAVIDVAIARSGRPDRLTDCISWARLTMRECQVLSVFELDLVEDELTATADPHFFTIPNIFRQMRTVAYPLIFDPQGNNIYPPMIMPGRKQRGLTYYWYPTGGDTLVFAGTDASSSDTSTIAIAYYTYFTALRYYTSTETKPATFAIADNDWTYASASTDDEKETARDLVTNWLLFDWFDLVVEGTLAKLYKTNNDARSVPTFALYKSLQKDLERGAGRIMLGPGI